MQAIPEVASSAHNDTTQQILSMEGLVWALDEILNESDCVSACKIDPLRRGIGVQF